jgi:tripartite-type tricarboxylate transporter receptor subunit TctC
VENIGGGSGQIALNKVARAKPDGHTLLFTVGSFLTVAPHLFPKANLDPLRLFAPVAMLTAFPTMLVSSAKLPISDFKSFVAHAKANPDKLNFASPGAGSNPHLAVEAIKQRLGIGAAHVPYRGGGPALAAVMAGDVDFACTEPSNLLAQMESGQLRALAVADSKRHPAFPDVPTFKEMGFDDLEFRAWSAVMAPAATPDAVIRMLQSQLWQAVRSDDVTARFTSLKLEPALSDPEELRAIIQHESDQWKPLIEALSLAQTE